jgi:PIN domain nuclease of toxin-antitoxin system
MRLLLDNHAFVWFAYNAQDLPDKTRELLEDASTELNLSLASVWEMAIKVSIGKLQLAEKVTDLVTNQMTKDEIELLSITLPHLDLIETLPFHHKDPFDRLLIAQAQVESIAIVSIDAAFDSYGVNRIWLT